jgi:hypothetical protein
MSKSGLEQLVRRLLIDQAFREAVARDLPGALRDQSLALSAAERALLARLDLLLLSDLEEAAGGADRVRTEIVAVYHTLADRGDLPTTA